MNIWKSTKWKSYYKNADQRQGIRIRYEKGVDPEVKRAIGDFINWLRSEYVFPKRVNLYVKAERRIRATNGEFVCGTFFRPADRNKEPYIRVATGDYYELLSECGKDNALARILSSIASVFTYYFQWLNDIELTFIGEDRQASFYAKKIMYDYSETRDHP